MVFIPLTLSMGKSGGDGTSYKVTNKTGIRSGKAAQRSKTPDPPRMNLTVVGWLYPPGWRRDGAFPK